MWKPLVRTKGLTLLEFAACMRGATKDFLGKVLQMSLESALEP